MKFARCRDRDMVNSLYLGLREESLGNSVACRFYNHQCDAPSHSFIVEFLFRTHEISDHGCSLAFLLVLADLLELAHLSLGARLADEFDPVDADCLGLAVASLDVDDEGRRLLELDESQADVGRPVRVPVVFADLNGLRGIASVGLGEVHVLRPVGVEVDDARAGWRIVAFRRDGGDLQMIMPC